MTENSDGAISGEGVVRLVRIPEPVMRRVENLMDAAIRESVLRGGHGRRTTAAAVRHLLVKGIEAMEAEQRERRP